MTYRRMFSSAQAAPNKRHLGRPEMLYLGASPGREGEPRQRHARGLRLAIELERRFVSATCTVSRRPFSWTARGSTDRRLLFHPDVPMAGIRKRRSAAFRTKAPWRIEAVARVSRIDRGSQGGRCAPRSIRRIPCRWDSAAPRTSGPAGGTSGSYRYRFVPFCLHLRPGLECATISPPPWRTVARDRACSSGRAVRGP
jgi:hypothetical protein